MELNNLIAENEGLRAQVAQRDRKRQEAAKKGGKRG